MLIISISISLIRGIKIKFIKLLFLIFISFSFLNAQKEITLSTIYTNELDDKFQKFSALANYLEKNNQNNLKFNVKLHKSTNLLINDIRLNKIHIFIDSLYPSMNVMNQTDMSIVCKNWKKGTEGYRSILFVKKDSDIKKIEDLNTKSIAFEDEFSTSAYFIPKKMIEEAGLELTQADNTNSKVRYIFANSEDNVSVKVFFDQVDAGALDDKNFNGVNKNDSLRTIFESKIIPRSVASFSNFISKKDQNEILRVLYEMNLNQEGKDVLQVFEKSTKFSPLKPEDLELIESLLDE